jgi:hypothetical protein
VRFASRGGAENFLCFNGFDDLQMMMTGDVNIIHTFMFYRFLLKAPGIFSLFIPHFIDDDFFMPL